MNLKINSFITGLLFLILFSSCYEHTEGCRDINALNFDVIADQDCENDCCKYPNVYINFSLVNDSVTIDTNSVMVNKFNDTFRIKYFRMYASGFKLVSKSGDTLTLLDKIPVGINRNDNIKYENINFTVTKFKAKQQSYNLGNLTRLDNYKELIFDFGLDSIVNHGIMDKVDISNPLYPTANDMYLDSISGYHFLKLELELMDNFIRSVYVTGDENKMKLSIKGDFDFKERENHHINLKLDISKWLLPLDFYKNSDELRSSLLNNLNESLILY